MPDRNQQQDRTGQNQGVQNPGTFSPDDDEAQEADVTRAAPEDLEEQEDAEEEELDDEEEADYDDDEDE
jgi:hypothetical protein